MAAIEMPPYLASRKFDLTYAQQLSPTGEAGFVQTLNRTTPFWTAQYMTGPLTEDKWRLWTKFLDQLEGSTYTFLGYDPRRPMPYGYFNSPITADPWTQTGQTAPRITAIDYVNGTITLDRLQNGASIYYGDYVSAQINNIWYLWRSQSIVGAVAGNTATIYAKPRIDIPDFVTADIRYRMACIEMKIIGRPDESDQGPSDLPSYTFNAGQYTARVPV